VEFQLAQAFVKLTKALAVFFSVIILFEIVIAVYVHVRIDRVAEETLDPLSNRQSP
jgi:hypothetical protein